MLKNITRLHPGPQFEPAQAQAFAATLGAMINAGLELLDVLGGDPDDENVDEFGQHPDDEPDDHLEDDDPDTEHDGSEPEYEV